MDDIDYLIFKYTSLSRNDPRYQACRDAIEQALQEATPK